MSFHAPIAVLHRSPEKEIELAVALSPEHMNVIGAVGSDPNVIFIGRASGERAVVRLEDRAPFVDVSQTEDTQLAGGFAGRNGDGESSVKKIYVEFTHGINLIDAACGACPKKSEVVATCVEGKLRAIEATAHRGEAKIADEALRDARVNEGGET